jgi:eukaryotic-like serine/threonine-protein kinase
MINKRLIAVILRFTLFFTIVSFMSGCGPVTGALEGIITQFKNQSDRSMIEGDHLLEEGRKSEALLAYRQAVEQNPHNLPALQKLAKAYSDQGRKRLARQYLQAALLIDPENIPIKGELLTLNPSPVASSPLLLQFEIPLENDIPTGFTISDSIVYVSYEKGAVKAVDPENGLLVWQTTIPSPITNAPGQSAGSLLIGSEDGKLYALSKKDGKILWAYPTGSPIYAAPSATQDTIYCGSSDGTLYAIKVTDGSLLWKFPTSGALRSQPALFEKWVIFGSADSHIYAVDQANGSPFWENGIITQGAVESQPVISNGRVMFGSGDGRVYSLDLKTGGEYWRYSTPDSVYASPLINAGTAFIASSGQMVAAVNEISGETLWETPIPIMINLTPALFHGIIIFAGPGDPKLYSIDQANGKILWKMDTGDWIAASPLVDREKILILGKDGTLLVYK